MGTMERSSAQGKRHERKSKRELRMGKFVCLLLMARAQLK